MTSYPDEHVPKALTLLKQRLSVTPDIGIVTGSGLGGIVQEMENPVRIPYADIPHFPVSSVTGHAGEIIVGRISGRNLFALSGRVHYYEGYALGTVTFPIKVMAAFGVRAVILTNAAGGINPEFSPGDVAVITGQIDLIRKMSLHPVTGMQEIKEVYDPSLRQEAFRAAEQVGAALKSGVYAAVTGPSYETPAEIKALRIMGADMVGMSTVPEAAEANRLGMKVMGLSLITNLAAGISVSPLSHREVIEISGRILPTFKLLVKQIIKKLNPDVA